MLPKTGLEFSLDFDTWNYRVNWCNKIFSIPGYSPLTPPTFITPPMWTIRLYSISYLNSLWRGELKWWSNCGFSISIIQVLHFPEKNDWLSSLWLQENKFMELIYRNFEWESLTSPFLGHNYLINLITHEALIIRLISKIDIAKGKRVINSNASIPHDGYLVPLRW